MYKLRRYLKDYKKECTVGPLCKLFEAILELLVPLVTASIIDVGVKNGDSAYVLKMGGVMILLAVVGLCSALVCQYFASRASQGVGTKIRSDLFLHINSLSHAELDRLGTPSLITRITNDTNQVQQAVAMSIRLFTRAPFIVIGSMVMAMTINLKLSVIFFIAALLIAAALYFVMSRSIPIFGAMQKKLDKIGLISRENLSGNRVIRAFSKQESEKKRIDAATEDLAKTSIRVSRLSALLSPVTYAVTDLAVIAIIYFGAINVNNGAGMQSGDIIALVNYMTQILLAMIVVANLVVLLTKASASAARINEVFETEPSVKEKTREIISVDTGKSTPKVEFNDVSFTYGDGDNELDNISFKIMRGQTVGIIGGTGSGKSTLINLIPRFYDAASGSVSVDGVNVKEYSFLQLRSQIGIVPQQSVLFSGTVRENMKWQNKDAGDEDIINALKIAQAYEFVEKLPNGLDSYVEQGGRNFSGGQRQRLCIARAIAGNPKLLILDDSFSALDFATDAALRRALKQSTSDMTVIIVTQRCSTIKNADRILVLDDGVLAGSGTHSELFDTCDCYREICLSQLNEAEAKR
ncbi:MAG: ABC transporter ATP-binding protein/permease [Clostridiales bacterium]|nr:ABC transporter ATP-binding protein/permease [Clostridiales bacterium]